MTNIASVFNSPIETGLRCLTILEAGYPKLYDIERITYYDYLLVHSGDIMGGPESIHPSTPHRTGEMIIRRPVIEEGLKIMISRGLIDVSYSSSGIEYLATDFATPFLDSLQANYTKKIMEVSCWVVNEFDSLLIEDLKVLIKGNMDVWGGEFLSESIVRGESLV